MTSESEYVAQLNAQRERAKRVAVRRERTVFWVLMTFGVVATVALVCLWPAKPFTEMTPADNWVGPQSIARRCLLLAGISGWLGGVVYSLYSYVRYLGESKLNLDHWWAWYLAHPLLGALVGMVAYFVYGGVMKPADANPEIANALLSPAGLCGFSAMAGMLSRTTIEKLADIFRKLIDAPGSAVESIDEDEVRLLALSQVVVPVAEAHAAVVDPVPAPAVMAALAGAAAPAPAPAPVPAASHLRLDLTLSASVSARSVVVVTVMGTPPAGVPASLSVPLGTDVDVDGDAHIYRVHLPEVATKLNGWVLVIEPNGTATDARALSAK